jgi:hypothetical protein
MYVARMEGIEVLMKVHERHPSIAAVAMSGGGRMGNVELPRSGKEAWRGRNSAKAVHV